MLGHYGVAIGMRHARKHLAWALDTAAAIAGVSADRLKAARSRVLTATDPAIVVRRLAEAFDAFGAAKAERNHFPLRQNRTGNRASAAGEMEPGWQVCAV